MADSVDGLLTPPADRGKAAPPNAPALPVQPLRPNEPVNRSRLWNPFSWWRRLRPEEINPPIKRGKTRFQGFLFWLVRWLPVLGPAAVLSIAWFYRPYVLDGPEICQFHKHTGLPCPTCGMTRSFCFMIHGEYHEAFGFNGLGPPLFVLTAVIGLVALLRRLKLFPYEFVPPRGLLWSLGLILLGCYAVRLYVLLVDQF